MNSTIAWIIGLVVAAVVGAGAYTMLQPTEEGAMMDKKDEAAMDQTMDDTMVKDEGVMMEGDVMVK